MTEEDEDEKKKISPTIIQRGSVLSLEGYETAYFLCTIVCRVDGSKKRFPSLPSYNPEWCPGKKDNKY
eukprot:8998532-Ditylum_brightwellii.AAC.1